MLSSRQHLKKFTKAIGKIQKKIRKKKFTCIFPRCNRKAIGSHSQQKEGQLRSIAEKGIVYGLNRNFYHAIKSIDRNTQEKALKMIPLGVSEASVFQGYCDNHDMDLFYEIEKKILDRSNKKQAILFFIRSISYEYVQKKKGVFFYDLFLDELEEMLPDDVVSEVKYVRYGTEYCVTNDAPHYLNAGFRALKESRYDDFTIVWFTINKNILISSSCCFSPLRDNHVAFMAKNIGKPQPLITFNLIPSPTETHVILSWLKEHDKHTDWIANLAKNPIGQEDLINICAFSESEDTCINPTLWDSTDENIKSQILNSMIHWNFRGELSSIPKLIKI